jgi:uncharacterized protein (TIGR03435 family)
MDSIRSTCTFALVTLLTATTASAQAPAPAPAAATSAASFEVASIKPSNPDPSNPLTMVPMALPRPGGRFTATSMPLKMLIALAFETQDFRIAGGPPELMTARFDITAKAAGGATLGQKDINPLVKNLLIERFKLKAHTEPRELQVYDLVLARSDGRLGPELKPSKSDCSKADELNATRAEALSKGDLSGVMAKPGEVLTCTVSPNVAGGPANISVHGDGQEIKQLIELLTQLTGRHIRDKTGLTGRYDFDMKLDLQALLAMARGMGLPVPAAANIPQSDGSSLTTALNEQLGLKLDSVRAPVDVLVIDSVDAPVPD